jgi:hypothetical protein
MGKILIPNTYLSNLGEDKVIFLGGPIRGAPNWQDDAILFLLSLNSNLTIISPRRGVRDKIAPYIAVGDESYFSRQRAWERHYLDIASKKGAIMFWLPGEEKHDCKKSYGAGTRLELGEWMTNYKHDKKVGFCIGSDGNFSELRTIEYDLSLDAPDKVIRKTMIETCLEALSIAGAAQQ